MMIKYPKISVVSITYGHQDYILETIKGVLMQKYNGDIEFIIANDNSPDDTHRVVTEFLDNSTIPSNVNIKYTKHENNLGMMPNFIWALQQANGKYIALCEGDDYWTDPLKLQKQVSFLEANLEYGLIGTGFENFDNLTDEIVARNNFQSDYEIDFESNLLKNKIGTLTAMFRSIYVEEYINLMESDLLKGISIGDYQLWLTILKYKKGYNLKDVTSRYRVLQDSATGRVCRNRFLMHLQSCFRVQLYFIHTLPDSSKLLEIVYRKHLLDLFLSDYIEVYRIEYKKFKMNGFHPKCREFFCNLTSETITLKKIYRKIIILQLYY